MVTVGAAPAIAIPNKNRSFQTYFTEAAVGLIMNWLSANSVFIFHFPDELRDPFRHRLPVERSIAESYSMCPLYS